MSYKDTDKRNWKEVCLYYAVRKQMSKMSPLITHKADHLSTEPLALARKIGKQKLVMPGGGY